MRKRGRKRRAERRASQTEKKKSKVAMVPIKGVYLGRTEKIVAHPSEMP